MTLTELKEVARVHQIKMGKMGKMDLVRAIQSAEGNWACFGTAIDGNCDQTGCRWREDCLEKKQH